MPTTKVSANTSRSFWMIDNFTEKLKNVEDYVLSPGFKTSSSGVMWTMCVVKSEGIFEDYLSLYLRADTAKAEATFSIKIRDRLGNEVLKFNGCEDASFDVHQGCGFVANFVTREYLVNPANDVLDRNTLTVVCEITPSKEKETTKMKIDETIGEEMEIFRYVSLISEGKTVPVLKCAIAKCSPVFAAMFRADMKENRENEAYISDISHEVLVELVRFVYTGKVNNILPIVDELAVAADKYQLDNLKRFCEETIGQNLSEDIVYDCLDFAQVYYMDTLKRYVIDFIDNMNLKKEDFMRSLGWPELPSHIAIGLYRARERAFIQKLGASIELGASRSSGTFKS